MIYFLLSYEKIHAPSLAARGIAVLPLHRSLSFFHASHNVCHTICARSKLWLLSFEQAGAVFRPILPRELFSLQGMPLGDVFPDMESSVAEVWLHSVMSFCDVRRLTGMAFHVPSALAALLCLIASSPRLDTP